MPRRVTLAQLEHGSPEVTRLVLPELLADSAKVRIATEWREALKELAKRRPRELGKIIEASSPPSFEIDWGDKAPK